MMQRSLSLIKNVSTCSRWTRSLIRPTPSCSYCSTSSSSPPPSEPPIPTYGQKPSETTEMKRARLLYQSRKRGMLENDLILSNFADKYLKTFNEKQLAEYDFLINMPSNDWDLYYWLVGLRETPKEFECEVMQLLKEHVKNVNKENRTRQPDLNS